MGSCPDFPLGQVLKIERDEGILHRFSWLKTHISRQRGKQLGRLTEKLSSGAGPSNSVRLSSGEDSDDDTHDVALAIQEDLHLLLHLFPSQSQSPKSSHLISSLRSMSASLEGCRVK